MSTDKYESSNSSALSLDSRAMKVVPEVASVRSTLTLMMRRISILTQTQPTTDDQLGIRATTLQLNQQDLQSPKVVVRSRHVKEGPMVRAC